MQPTQLASLAVYMANQPNRFGALRHANTSTGQTARQNPHALHMSSAMTTSHLPAGPREPFLSTLNSGIRHSVSRHRLGHDLQLDLSLRLNDDRLGARSPRPSADTLLAAGAPGRGAPSLGRAATPAV